MTAPTAQNRRHKPHPERADYSPREVAAEAAALPYLTLAATLGRDPDFMRSVAAVRHGECESGVLAQRYAPKASRGRELVGLMLRVAAAQPDCLTARLALDNLATRRMTVWGEEPVDLGDRARWQRSNVGHRQAAELVARRGAGRCLGHIVEREHSGETIERWCPVELTGRRLWCDPHTRQLSAAERASAERSMRTLLAAAARAVDGMRP